MQLCKKESLFFKAALLSVFYFILFFFCAATTASTVTQNVWIPGWQLTSSMTIPRAGAAIASHDNHIYVIGGVDGVNFLDTVESASINADGTLTQWKVVSRMPAARGFMSATIHSGRMYVVGGGNGPFGKHLLSSIISAPILANGELGEWRTEIEKMLTPRRCSKLIVNDDKLHVFGGFSGALLDTVESSSFSSDGKLTPWSMGLNTMTMPRYVNEVKKMENYAVVFGGHHPTKGKGISDVEFADLSQKSLVWKTMAPMNVGRYAFSGAAHNQFLYALGGISGTEYLNTIEKFLVSADTLSTKKPEKWSMSSKLPAFMANFTTLVIGDRIYLLGGSTRFKYMPTVWVATFNSSGDIGHYGTDRQLASFNLLKQAKKNVTTLPNSGTVLERIVTDGYTYLRVLTSGKTIWLAAPKMDIAVNTNIRFSEGVYMSNFRSKSLNRNFAAILFVGTVEVK